jgi:acyl carrier protein
VRRVTADEIRKFILGRLQGPLEAKGLSPSSVPDDFDLLTEGVVNSMGMVELVVAVEQQFATRLDFEELDPESLTIVGPLCKYIEERSSTGDLAGHEGMLGRI